MPMPSCLQAVRFRDTVIAAGALDGLLQPLTGLTGLGLALSSDFRGGFPASLAQLSQLQWLYIDTQETLPSALPAGSWTHSLRRLALEFNVAEASVPQLSQPAHLSHLSLLTLPEKGKTPELLRRWEAFWRFAAHHPPLISLDCRGLDDYFEPAIQEPIYMLEACMRLAAKRPRLQVSVVDANPDELLDELLAMPPADEV